MQDIIFQLKNLNAAYIAALEYDRCPSEDEAQEVDDLLETGITFSELQETLTHNKGRRPDEIASSMSHLTITLETT